MNNHKRITRQINRKDYILLASISLSLYSINNYSDIYSKLKLLYKKVRYKIILKYFEFAFKKDSLLDLGLTDENNTIYCLNYNK